MYMYTIYKNKIYVKIKRHSSIKPYAKPYVTLKNNDE